MVKVRQIARFHKAAAMLSAYFRPEGIDECMRCWVAYMNSQDGTRRLGIRTQQGLLGDGDAYGEGGHDSVYDHQNETDTKIAIATDAMIDSLKVIHRWAIYKTYGMGNGWQQWDFRSADLAEVTAEGLIALTEKLKKNVCTATLF